MDYFIQKPPRKKKRRTQRTRRPANILLVILAAVALLIYKPLTHWLDSQYQTAGLHTTPSTLSGEELRVHFIDVGQGLSILIQTPAQNILYDSGEVDQAHVVTTYLESQGVDRLDLMIASHPHSDHIGSMYSLTAPFEVNRVIMSEIPTSELPSHRSWRNLSDAFNAGELTSQIAKPGDVYDLGGGVQMTVLGPSRTDYDSLNLFSLVCRIDYGEDSFLLTGDMEAKNEIELLETLSPDLLQADVLSLGHHGSKTSSTAKWLDAVAPSVAVASVGLDNSYGHPHNGVVERLERRNIDFYRTDIDGSVVFSSFGSGYRVLEDTVESPTELPAKPSTALPEKDAA